MPISLTCSLAVNAHAHIQNRSQKVARAPESNEWKSALTRLRLNVSQASLVASVLDAISSSMNNRIAEKLVSRACPTLSGLLPLIVERTFRIMLQNIGFDIFLNVFCYTGEITKFPATVTFIN